MKSALPVSLILLFVISACSTTKSLKKGEVLYTGSSIKTEKIDYGDEWEIEQRRNGLAAISRHTNPALDLQHVLYKKRQGICPMDEEKFW